MSDRKLHTKTVYILAWVILVCAGILIKTGITDDVWKLVYSGIYGSSSGETGESIYSPGAAEPDVYCYMDYWESQVREVCEEGRTYQTEDADSEGEASSQAETSETSAPASTETTEAAQRSADARTVSAMADIMSSYIGMDADTLLSYCYNATYPKCVKKDELDAENLLGKDLSLDMDTGGYKVLIYHTHGSEAFADSRPGEVDDTVIGLGNRLAEILTDTYGIPVIIDLHRDGVPDDTHLVTDVDGKPTAQIMLLNGMCRDEDGNDVDYWSNDNKVDNMAFALQTYLAGRANYGDMMRKIYISTSRYNMDLMPHAMLAEIGAQTNTVEEEYNAIEPFAAMLAKVLLK